MNYFRGSSAFTNKIVNKVKHEKLLHHYEMSNGDDLIFCKITKLPK